ncbi:toxin cluster protein 2 [Metarhizium guizhouense ARSEF 977]|uniref:Toxin cluster protein 2 n=1 Tax=Metarhizium guizhouense (strain ARSEF 977) TaxID=1276136 RepID=A0A0B4GRD5_METGA|nr:toxin cluster protein 2 [Metarhizium guizhouense ARSEF 977]
MTKADLTLSYTDGRPPTIGIKAVNEVLRTVGVHASRTPSPPEARPILEASKTRALSEDEQAQLISMFSLHRSDLLAQIQLAGRTPEVHDGGHLNTSEHGVAPYPKVYDMQAMDQDAKHLVQARFGRLHVNTTDKGVGIDEVMTVVSGGPMTWFYQLPDGVVVKLSVPVVETGGPAWRLSYPGKRPHGAFLDAEHGLIVAYAHGPEKFVMRYEAPGAQGPEALATNPWIDFGGDAPRMLDDVTMG